MMWKKILKMKIKSFSDARRAGKEYAPEAYYESMILPLEEYRNLPHNERSNLHQKLITLLKDYGDNIPWAKDRITFHRTMMRRARRGDDSTMLPDQVSTYVDPRPGRAKHPTPYKRRRPNRTKEEKEASRRKKQRIQQNRRKNREEEEQRREQRITRNKMIIDYFTMWRNMYNRVPTLAEIINSEGRPLTVDEEATYNEEYARRTQE